MKLLDINVYGKTIQSVFQCQALDTILSNSF